MRFDISNFIIEVFKLENKRWQFNVKQILRTVHLTEYRVCCTSQVLFSQQSILFWFNPGPHVKFWQVVQIDLMMLLWKAVFSGWRDSWVDRSLWRKVSDTNICKTKNNTWGIINMNCFKAKVFNVALGQTLLNSVRRLHSWSRWTFLSWSILCRVSSSHDLLILV